MRDVIPINDVGREELVARKILEREWKKDIEKSNKRYRVYLTKGREKQYIGTIAGNEVVKSVSGYNDKLKQVANIIDSEGVYGIVVEEERDEQDIDKVLVIDDNLGLEFARRIGIDGYESYYAVVSGSPYPKMSDTVCGYGFSEIKKIMDWGEGLEEGCNVIMFTDSGFGALADWLRSKGYAVFGSDDITEKLELDRVYVRKVFEKLGISVPNARIVRGVKNVVETIKEINKKVYIKISRVRGDVETFGTSDPKEAEVRLSKGLFRVLGDDISFVLEDSLDDMIEIGIDCFFNGKEWIGIVMDTVECSGMGNMTRFVDINDTVWYDVLMKLEPYLRKNGYRGMFCMEGFYNGDNIYVTDITPRMSYICGYAYPKVIDNFSEVIIGVANGEYVEPKIDCKYSVQIGVYTDDPNTERIIEYNRDDDWWIAYRRVVKVDGKIWFVPGDYVVAVAISGDNQMNKAFKDAIERAEAVKTTNIYTQGREFVEYAMRLLEKGEEIGYEW